MTDIVERLRLRRDPLTDGERAEAAEEIQLLRSRCDSLEDDVYLLKAQRDHHGSNRSRCEESLRRAQGEIERLREALGHVSQPV